MIRQMRTEDTAAEREDKQKTFEFMQNFRQTFSRPVVRIEFLGLFDVGYDNPNRLLNRR